MPDLPTGKSQADRIRERFAKTPDALQLHVPRWLAEDTAKELGEGYYCIYTRGMMVIALTPFPLAKEEVKLASK